jgi:hypothetical protein
VGMEEAIFGRGVEYMDKVVAQESWMIDDELD